MSPTRTGPERADAASPAIALAIERFEADWRSSPESCTDPAEYLPDDPAQRPAALVALLLADLALRWRMQERRPIEWYRDHYPELDGESLVALLYEEYCLREEDGEWPEAADYRARFPDVADSFQEVLEIHELVGRARAPASRGSSRGGTQFPEAGQTIGGFRLVEELGRGAFARVYLAEEQHLADRPVALKVTRTGSREPQTLARLQHTHIVPVYSYRTDAATGLHLLCMPHLGRITLLQILGQPELQAARTGADLIDLLDRLQPPDVALVERAASRAALERRTYAQAIAWWGARMAEALQHAHDRQILHRDVKPSNVLVTGDGLPMLLDFNLAQEPLFDHSAPSPGAVGGTLAYMAPEQLEALAAGASNPVDARSDLYALGVVLFDCLARGVRPFALPPKSSTMTEALLGAAEARRAGPPRLRSTHPDVPPALEAVVRRCLAPEPDDRYASAAQLAADLQAVADDTPLRFAREPIPSRCVRWVRRNRRRLAIAAPLILALGVSACSLVYSQLAALRLEAEVGHWVNEGQHSAEAGQLELALSHFDTAERLALGDAGRLGGLLDRIRHEYQIASETKAIRDKADELFRVGERLRFSLLGFGGDPKVARGEVESALAKFSIPDDPAWARQKRIGMLDGPRRERIIGEVNELLFLWIIALDREWYGDSTKARQAIRICDVALASTPTIGPWRAIRARCAATLAGEPTRSHVPARTESEASARGCFQWALLCDLEGRAESAVAWLERATQLEPSDYWSHFYLGSYHQRLGRNGRAMEHFQAAVALRPNSPWARSNRSLLYRARGDWDQALDDLNRALAGTWGAEFLEGRLNLGLVKQGMGDDAGARAAYESVIAAAGPRNPFARAGRLNRAMIDIDDGALDRAWAEYSALLAEDPRDDQARLSRAFLALQLGRAAQSEVDLTALLQQNPERADEILARRALARLALGRLEGAEEDAAGAYRRKPSPSRERLWVRTLLALHRGDELSWLNRPDDLAILPVGGPSLQADLRATAERLRSAVVGAASGRIHRTRAVLLSALNDPSAEAEASRAIELTPESADAYLVRARIRRVSGDRAAAQADVESALTLVPGDPRLLEFRGVLKTEMGNPGSALIDLDRAILRGAQGTIRAPRALALMALGRDEDAVRDWSLALDDDPEDPGAYLGRARARIRLGLHQRALGDLEQAAVWAADNPMLLRRITAVYAQCLGARPDRFPRWLGLVRRTWSAWMTAARPAPG